MSPLFKVIEVIKHLCAVSYSWHTEPVMYTVDLFSLVSTISYTFLRNRI